MNQRGRTADTRQMWKMKKNGRSEWGGEQPTEKKDKEEKEKD
jgi:hypothetical protein